MPSGCQVVPKTMWGRSLNGFRPFDKNPDHRRSNALVYFLIDYGKGLNMCHESEETELERILSESRKFRDKCKKNIELSKKLCRSSSLLIDDIQAISEDAAVLLEEKIVMKEEAIAIMKIASGGKVNRNTPIYVAVEDEVKIIKESYRKLSEIKISENNLSLLKLKEEFLVLFFLEYK